MKKPENEQKKMNEMSIEETVASENDVDEAAVNIECTKSDADDPQAPESDKTGGMFGSGVADIDSDEFKDAILYDDDDEEIINPFTMASLKQTLADPNARRKMYEDMAKRERTLGDLMGSITTEINNLKKWKDMLDCRSVFPDFYTEQLIREGEGLFCSLLSLNPIKLQFSDSFESGEYLNVFEAICDIYIASEQQRQFADWRNCAAEWMKKQEKRWKAWEAADRRIGMEAILKDDHESRFVLKELRRWSAEADKMKAQTDRLRELILKVDLFLMEYKNHCEHRDIVE